MTGLEITGVSKSFGDRQVLRAIDLRVSAGEVVGFVGPNGAGKTTCLRILIGLTPRDAGNVSVLGMDPVSSDVAIRKRCCYLPGETSVYQGMTGHRFLQFAWGFYQEQHDDLRQQMMEHFGLPLRRRVRHYSAGMKQQLALMACLVPDVDAYILDEPDKALDATTRFFLRDLLRTLKARGKSVLMSSHHLREVEALADRLVFLMDGQIIEDSRIEAARRDLKKQIRLVLAEGATVPEGARVLRQDPDGSHRVVTDGDPLKWLSKIPHDQMVSAEVGTIRLEDLYRLLMTETEEVSR